MRRIGMFSLVAVGLTALILGGCITHDSENDPARFGSGTASLEMNLTPSAPLAPPPDKTIKNFGVTLVGGSAPLLPKWKTNWERNIERLTAYSKAHGLPYADSYDDYRKNNFDLFEITKAPTTTGFRMPAEYEASQAYLLNWKSSSMTGAWKKLFQDIIKGAWGVVPVILPYEHAMDKYKLETELKTLGYKSAEITKNVIFFKQKTNAIWARDFGPVSIVSTPTTGTGKLSFVDFRYYHTRIYDDEVPTQLAKEWGINAFRPDLDFEGGNLMNTADGLCAATKGVLNYNLQFTQSAIEKIFKDYLGCKKILFPEPMTGGVIAHIDMFSKFASTTSMIVGKYTTTQHPANAKILDANAALFAKTPTPGAKTIVVTRIPMPDVGTKGTSKIWRTYTNSTSLSNGTKKVVLVPTYDDETTNEKAAMAAYAKAFVGWTFVKIDSKIVIPGQGAIHCITMQIPLGTRAKMETAPGPLCGAQSTICKKASCGNIDSKGCCDGTTLKYCNSGKLSAMNCKSNPSCGWNTKNSWYDCGTSGGADPAGKYKKSCNVITDAGPKLDSGGSAGCGKVTYSGCCDGESLYYCETGKLKKLDCTKSPKCGWDSKGSYYNCGTGGTSDPSGKNVKSCKGKVPEAGVPDAAKPDQGTTVACGNVSNQGCCDGQTLKYCDSGKLKVMDCSKNPKCGWSTANSFYDCGTAGTSDPAGKYPIKCGATAADMGTPDKSAPDKTVTTDSAAPDQTVATPDTGSPKKDASKKEEEEPEEGSSCSVGTSTPTGSLPLMMLLVLGALIFVRRRR